MSEKNNKPRVLISGCSGHAGQGLVAILSRHYRLRGLDLRPCEVCDEMTLGSVADLYACRCAMADVDALVTCHMGSQPLSYQPPFEGVEINIRGTLNLYQAAQEQGVKRVVQVSSACVLPAGATGGETPGELPRRLNPRYNGAIYALTKTVEEMIAGIFLEQHGIVTTVLRPSWVVREADRQTKYKATEMRFTPELIDPLDIGDAVLCCLRRDATSVEGFLLGQPEYLSVKRTMSVLGWEPRHRFDVLRRLMQEVPPPEGCVGQRPAVSVSEDAERSAKLFQP